MDFAIHFTEVIGTSHGIAEDLAALFAELVLLITPRIMSSVEDTRDIVDELRRKLQSIETLLPAVGTVDLPANGDMRKRPLLASDTLTGVAAPLRVTPEAAQP